MSRVYCYVTVAKPASVKMASMKEKAFRERLYAYPVDFEGFEGM
jgi:hypothetical protein